MPVVGPKWKRLTKRNTWAIQRLFTVPPSTKRTAQESVGPFNWNRARPIDDSSSSRGCWWRSSPVPGFLHFLSSGKDGKSGKLKSLEHGLQLTDQSMLHLATLLQTLADVQDLLPAFNVQVINGNATDEGSLTCTCSAPVECRTPGRRESAFSRMIRHAFDFRRCQLPVGHFLHVALSNGPSAAAFCPAVDDTYGLISIEFHSIQVISNNCNSQRRYLSHWTSFVENLTKTLWIANSSSIIVLLLVIICCTGWIQVNCSSYRSNNVQVSGHLASNFGCSPRNLLFL